MSPMSLPSCMYSSEPASSNSEDCPTSVKQMDMMLIKEEQLPPNFGTSGVNEACLYQHRNPPNYMDAVYQNGACAYQTPQNIPVFLNTGYSTNRAQNVNGVVKRKRVRTAFTTNQLQDLEDQYRINRYLERGTRIFLSRKLNVSERVIKIWFQNRRMKEKKDRSECQIVDSCTLPAASSSTQDYEPPFPAYNILPQAINTSGLMNCDSFIYDQNQAVNIGIAPMMVEQHGLMPRSAEPPTATEAVHYNRYPHNMPPPYESEVSSTVFSDFTQYCDAYNNE
ncbi:homeobox protein Hox-B4-like [Aricia agestis]|uniref:homeobox protein Hox-B4-like n=1 Tax=Aricia agestis TaxID=91739 RepID=UPI001C2019C2|nr:homeobox protein Hox-B4-like [Aricia agestis]